MKLPILVAAHRLAERGLLDLSRPVRVHDDFSSRNPGHRFVMDQGEDSDPETWAARGGEVALGVLAHRMITVSGNLATNLVLDAGRHRRGRRCAGVGRLLTPDHDRARHRGLRRP